MRRSSRVQLVRALLRLGALAFGLAFCVIGPAFSATKPHVITFGRGTVVKWYVGPAEDRTIDLRVRALFVDTRLKDYTIGVPHEVTDRLFVVRRVFRLNDTLPQEPASPGRWQWQRGGWLLVDRVTGRVAQIALPDFDPYYSDASWYRDYVAYCGVSDDGKKLFAVVAQLGRRKPLVKKPLGEPAGGDLPDSECPAPSWQRRPARVTFAPDDTRKLTFTIRGHVVDILKDESDEDEEDANTGN